MDKKKIDRINELAKKHKNEGLTEKEKEERAFLRAEYIAAFRENLRNTLDNTVIMDEDGNKRPLKKNP